MTDLFLNAFDIQRNMSRISSISYPSFEKCIRIDKNTRVCFPISVNNNVISVMKHFKDNGKEICFAPKDMYRLHVDTRSSFGKWKRNPTIFPTSSICITKNEFNELFR